MIPKVLVLANSKGGVGKSTLVRSLAAHWFISGMKPAIIDTDPQASLGNAYALEGPMLEIPIHQTDTVEELEQSIEELTNRFAPVLVDTAGFRSKTMILSLVYADLVLIPMKPAPEDIRPATEMLKLVAEINETPERLTMGRPLVAAMVITMSIRGTIIARHIRSELEAKEFPLLHAEMVNRIVYPEASLQGLAANLIDPEGSASRDIAAIAAELTELV